MRKQIWFVYTMVLYQVTGKKVDHSYFVKEGEDHGVMLKLSLMFGVVSSKDLGDCNSNSIST